jgi:hypothetical protein
MNGEQICAGWQNSKKVFHGDKHWSLLSAHDKVVAE